MAAEKAYYQHHERTTNSALESDLQVREIGIDPQNKYLVGYSEVLGLKLHAPTHLSTVVDFSLATVTSLTSVVTGNASVGGTLGVTGLLTASNGINLTGAGAGSRTINLLKSGSNRWAIVANGDAETGSNQGTLLQILAYDDSGSLIDSPFSINRATTGFNYISLNRPIALNAPYYSANCVLYTNGGTAIASSSNLTFNGTTLGLTGTLAVTGAVTISATLALTGIATFTATPVFSSATASTAAAFDASKNLVSVTNTGTGNNVLSASPTLTGTLTVGVISASGDLTISRSASGTQVLSTLANTSNTASSDAKQLIQTAGGSAGNPYLHFQVVGTYDWSMGIKRSSSGTFAISNSTALGTNDALTINTSGTVSVTAADLQVFRSTTGAVRIITENDNNANTTAHAYALMSVGGAAGGNPYVQFNIFGVVDWVAGVDNADSDKFKIGRSSAMGSNTALAIDASLNTTFGASVDCGGGAGTYFRLPRGTSNPSSPAIGYMYQNTADGHLYWYNGSAWVALA